MPRPPGRRAAALALLALALAVPLGVALVAVLDPTPHPLGEVAETEMRVRDVTTSHPPLVGLPGRIGELARQGSHPGPLSFYALWPTYRLLGQSAGALTAAGVVVHLAAIGVALWLAARRGGPAMALGVAVLLAVLVGAYGGALLTEPWNPYLPLLWWFTFLLAAWGVADADLPVLPVAVATGSFCVQTHLPYGGVVAAVLAAAVIAAAVRTVRRRDPGARRSLLVWGGVALAVAFVVWLPPLYEQVAEDRGNLTALVDHFSHPPEDAFGMDFAVHAVLDHLNVWHLLTRSGDASPFAGSSSVVPGLLLLGTWLGSVGVAWRLRAPGLLPLHLVTAVALLAGTFSVSRIFGAPNAYLVLWLFGITSLVVLAVAVTAVTMVGRLLPSQFDRRAIVACSGALVAGLVVVIGFATADAADTDPPRPELQPGFDAVVGPTVRALEEGAVPGTGPDGRYLVRADDPVDAATLTDGLVVALEREGLRAGTTPSASIRVRRSRVFGPDEATADVRLATGREVDRWRRTPGYTEIAAADPRTPGDSEAMRKPMAVFVGPPESSGA